MNAPASAAVDGSGAQGDPRHFPELSRLLREAWRDLGFAVLPGLAVPAGADLIAAADHALADRGHRRGNGTAYAARDLLDEAAVAAWAAAQIPWIAALLCPDDADPAGPTAVISALLLDKHASADWRLPMHQDLAVPVLRHGSDDIHGWGPWSRKDGTDHVQPPPHLSQHRLALRVHLDPCGPGSGELTVIPGSHRQLFDNTGRDDIALAAVIEHGPILPVHAEAGDVLVMHPWLLHASLPRSPDAPGRRRILHLEYAAIPLPPSLSWHRPTTVHAPVADPATVRP